MYILSEGVLHMRCLILMIEGLHKAIIYYVVRDQVTGTHNII